MLKEIIIALNPESKMKSAYAEPGFQFGRR
jgi:hypothetical protein